MKKVEKISLLYTEEGIPYFNDEDKKGARLTFQISSENEVEIYGNKKGLILLAKALLGLAECERNDGFHIHIDDLYNINDEDKKFIIYIE